MLNQSDIDGRLRLFRYGLIVIPIITFVVSLVFPWWQFSFVFEELRPPITQFLSFALIATVLVAVVCVGAYFAYSMVLKRSAGSDS